MSTITTICGLSPLVFLPGAGTELYRGVGAIVLFGKMGSAIVSLTFLPALTLTVLEWRQGKEQPEVPAGAAATPEADEPVPLRKVRAGRRG
jgi:multidrug efflux pump subunit AcrB